MLDTIYDGLVGGLDFTKEGWGGPECLGHTTTTERLADTCLALAVALTLIGLIEKEGVFFYDRSRSKTSEESVKQQ